MGAAGSTETLQGVLPTTTAAGRIACSGSATSPELTAFEDEGLFFRTAPSDAFQSQLLADNMAAEGYTSVAIVNRADDYGQAFADEAERFLTEAGAEVVASVPADPEGTNFDTEVEEVIAAAPDAVLLILFPEEGATILSTMIEQGAGPADIPIFVTDGLASDELGAAVDEANAAVVDGIVGTRPGAETPTDFNDRLTSEKDVTEVTFAAQFYDCTIATALGAVAAGTDDPVAIAAELEGVTSGGTPCATFEECAALLEEGEDIDYDGVTGFDWNADGEVSSATYEVWSFEGGVISPIEVVTIGGEEGTEPETTTTTGG
jgi:branched-chain amino acid transport system substrate-binding protein